VSDTVLRVTNVWMYYVGLTTSPGSWELDSLVYAVGSLGYA